MKISGFTMVKNAVKLYYPIKESILSVLPMVDEFVVALGNCDADDNTRTEIESIKSDKIKIIDTVWNLEKYPNGTENAHQTDIAKEACSGDWLFYLQADEVMHEKYLPVIEKRCKELYKDEEVEGLLFDYVHFWGDYKHYQVAHGWYPKEIRIIRNHPDIHSWGSAQSFRRIPGFNYKNYRQRENTYKLKVAESGAKMYHYGWVRPPKLMQNKRKALHTIHKGKKIAETSYKGQNTDFDYGPLEKCKKFTGSHPEVMQERVKQMNWQDKLRKSGPYPSGQTKFKHEKLKYRIASFIEQNILGGRTIGGLKNYILLKK